MTAHQPRSSDPSSRLTLIHGPVARRRSSWNLRLAGAFSMIALVGGLALGCKGDVTPIQSLLDDPSRYEGKDVRIAGTVKSAVGVLGYGVYKVDDGTGSITVLTRDSGAPREGAKVGVQGRVKAGYTLGSETLTVFLEDQRREP